MNASPTREIITTLSGLTYGVTSAARLLPPAGPGSGRLRLGHRCLTGPGWPRTETRDRARVDDVDAGRHVLDLNVVRRVGDVKVDELPRALAP